MKKIASLIICAGLSMSLTGCTLGDVIQQYTVSDKTAETTEPSEPQPRVYMSEVSGQLLKFTGNRLTLKNDEHKYAFDLSQATLECANGMIRGDEISVIYEGQLTDTDTSAVKALKVVDEFHQNDQLEERKLSGEILGITPNTITIRTKKKKTMTCPVTGAMQYYQNGLKIGNWVYIHYKGKYSKDSSDKSVLNADHLKVLSISDIEPLVFPEPTPTPAPPADAAEMPKPEGQLHAVIEMLNANILTVTLPGSETPVNIDLSAIPVALKGGAAPGSSVNISYTGERKDQALGGIVITAVTGEDPDSIALRNASATVSGVIVGSTANTITLQSPDNAFITCFILNAQNYSSCDLSEGASVRITFHPAQSRESNIYTAVKVENI